VVTLVAGEPTEPVFRRFERPVRNMSTGMTRQDWSQALREGIRHAVERQLMADVPVGALLSGGVDSAIVAGCMRDGLGSAPDCFAIGFASEPGGGELLAARRAATALRVPLHETAVADEDYLAAWPQLLADSGEPIANSGLLLVGMLCASVRRTHKVVLSGQGADEPLGGYPRHTVGRWNGSIRMLGPVLGLLPERIAASDRLRRLRLIAGAGDEVTRIAETLSVFGLDEASRLSRTRLDRELLTHPVALALGTVVPGADPLNRLLQVDARLSLADDLLLVADHMSMAHSVELRVPFLDLDLLAVAEQMPGRYKVSFLGERKWLYRQAVRPMLPPGLRSLLLGARARLGRKLGFATPMDRWFTHWVQADATATLLGPESRLPAVVRAEPVRALLNEAVAGRPRSRQLLSLFALEHWLAGHDSKVIARVA
jgi:asparagine synthase (glutamine-hydrolysing)